MRIFVHIAFFNPSIQFLSPLNLIQGCGRLEPLLAASGREERYTLDRSQARHRVNSETNETNKHAHGLLRLILNHLLPLHACLWTVGGSWCTWREPTHAQGEQEKPCTERGPDRIQSRNLLAATRPPYSPTAFSTHWKMSGELGSGVFCFQFTHAWSAAWSAEETLSVTI